MSNGSGLFGAEGPKKPHLVQGKGGVAGEVTDLRSDVTRALGGMAATTVDEFTDPAAADVDAIRLAAASVATAQTLSGADLDGAVGEAEMVPPRNVTVTTGAGGTPSDAPATTVINGKVRDTNGLLVDQTETITVSQIAGEGTGLLAFALITSIVEAAGDGTGASMSYGFGDVIGLGKPLRSRAGLEAVQQEIAAGVVVTTGTFVDAATAAPNGTYEPSAVPDASNDYAVYYEYTP